MLSNTDTFFIVFLSILCILGSVDGIRCKCTKESETVKCYEGVCETELGSCLMLDHPTMGQHYTCHTRGIENGHCHTRQSKSGLLVNICGCNDQDFCNYSLWPEKNTTHHHHSNKHHHQHHKEAAQYSHESTNSAANIPAISLISALLFFSLV
ncbi:unnamed protein product [Caenorhabditis angaria]|uniref:Activin types I and II receptor domain-containing protein n=1 Tax=Caenorhabditis angaria TaxID=860376 RepID=A0A9P1N299_9PELO|nr:unnamed protein product [Caenorhabditis angaria]